MAQITTVPSFQLDFTSKDSVRVLSYYSNCLSTLIRSIFILYDIWVQLFPVELSVLLPHERHLNFWKTSEFLKFLKDFFEFLWTPDMIYSHEFVIIVMVDLQVSERHHHCIDCLLVGACNKWIYFRDFSDYYQLKGYSLISLKSGKKK